jgi:hypothetical protein
MNLERDKAIEAMDVLTEHGYSVNLVAAVFPPDKMVVNWEGPLYRVSAPALTHDAINLRELCDLAESIGLVARLAFQEIRFEPKDRTPERHISAKHQQLQREEGEVTRTSTGDVHARRED